MSKNKKTTIKNAIDQQRLSLQAAKVQQLPQGARNAA